jgi:uncharacterized membrane protein
MANPIEQAEKKQQKYWRRFLIALFSLIVLLFVRFLLGSVFREHELNSHPIGIVILLLSAMLLIVLLTYIVKLRRLQSQITSVPQLREALVDNEFIKSNVAASWKVGFCCAVPTPLLLVLLSVKDPLVIAFATPIVGSVAFIVSLYLRNRRDD